jgi:hypothetical protein
VKLVSVYGTPRRDTPGESSGLGGRTSYGGFSTWAGSSWLLAACVIAAVSGFAVPWNVPAGSTVALPPAFAAFITVDPISPAGDSVEINGSGFAPLVPLTISLYGPPATSYLILSVETSTDSLGEFQFDLSLLSELLNAGNGTYLFVATDTAQSEANATYSFAGSSIDMELSPTHVVRGSSVNVSGHGFYPGDLTVYLGNARGYLLVGSASADPNGSFDGLSVSVPPTGASGAYLLFVTDPNHDFAGRPVTVSGVVNLSFVTEPETCLVLFDGAEYANGTAVRAVPTGIHAVHAESCPGWAFVSWVTTAGTLGDPRSVTTSVSVAANGTLAAIYSAVPAAGGCPAPPSRLGPLGDYFARLPGWAQGTVLGLGGAGLGGLGALLHGVLGRTSGSLGRGRRLRMGGLQSTRPAASFAEYKAGSGFGDLKGGSGLAAQKTVSSLSYGKTEAGLGEWKSASGLGSWKTTAGLGEQKAGLGEWKSASDLGSWKTTAGLGEQKAGPGLGEFKANSGLGAIKGGSGLSASKGGSAPEHGGETRAVSGGSDGSTQGLSKTTSLGSSLGGAKEAAAKLRPGGERAAGEDAESEARG